MNPEQNEQPTQVDQPPQPIPNNPTLNALAPQPEPVGQQATPNPIVEPAPAAVPAPEYSQPIQNAQTVAQPTVSQHNPKSAKKPFVIAAIGVVVLILAISGIVAANLINSSESSKSIDTELTTDDSQNSEPSNSETEKPAEDSATDTDTDASTTPESSQALMLERDTERKYELKNAQQELESYFNDNGEYPADWVVIVTDSENRTGPTGDPYTYVVAADLQTYTLSANLENDSDPKADANGNYVIISVNQ